MKDDRYPNGPTAVIRLPPVSTGDDAIRLFLKTATRPSGSTPEQIRSVFHRLDRSRTLSVLLAICFPLITIRAGHLLSPTQLRSIYETPIYRFGTFSPELAGLTHGRPLEVCPSIDERYTEHTRLMHERQGVRGVRRAISFALDYHRTSREIVLGKCSGGWVWQPGSTAGYLYAQFARDAPIAWIYKRLGGSEVTIGLFVLVSALWGTYGLGRLLRYLTDSNAIVALALAGFAWTVSVLLTRFRMELVWALYGLLTCWLIVCWNRTSTHRPAWTAAISVTALVIHLAGYMVVAYSAAVGAIAVSLGAMAMSVIARPSRQRILQFAVVAIGVWLVMGDCAAFSQHQLAPVSTLNFAGGGSFGELALSTGFWTERPNPVPYPLGDDGVYAAYRAEPLIVENAYFMYEYQGFKSFGQALLRATLLRHPLITIESACKRLFILVFKLPTLAQPLAAISPWFISASQVGAVLLLVLVVAVVCSPTRWHLELPLLLIPFWNVFGIVLLTHLVHTHSAYYLFGLIQLVVLAPALAVVLYGVSRSRRWNVGLTRRPTMLVTAAGLLIVLGVWAYTAARRELLTFDIWYGPWIGMYRAPLDREALEPRLVAAKIERLRTLGERTPGSISTFGVWMLSRLSTNVWTAEAGVGDRLQMTKDEVESRRREARTIASAYFRRAAAEAPDDPWILTFADTWDLDDMSSIYARLLDRHADHPFAAWWAFTLSRHSTGEARSRYTARLVDLAHRHFERTAYLRPQFVQMPSGDNPAVAIQHDGWTEVTVKDGSAPLIGATNAFRSDRLGLLVGIHAISGLVRARLVVETDRGTEESPEQLILDSDDDSYRMFKWNGSTVAQRMGLRVSTDPGTVAVVRIRDYYPMIENPRVVSTE